jgi:folate-dependent phosphoribosylglycinamide formyltransferase PurN
MNTERRIALILSQDTVFKTKFLILLIQLLHRSSIVLIIECSKKSNSPRSKVGIFTEWGWVGVLRIGGKIVKSKSIHFLFKRIGLKHQYTLKGISEKHSIPYIFTTNINNKELLRLCDDQSVDTVISFQHQKLLSEWLETYPNRVFNVHPSNLPKYRGVKPIHWAALNGDKTFSIVLHTVGAEFDTGEIWAKSTVRLSQNFSFYQYYHTVHILAAVLIADVMQDFQSFENNRKVTSASDHAYYRAPNKAHYDELAQSGWRRY